MELLRIILLVLALVLFIVAATFVPDPHRFRLVAAGLAALAGAFLVGAAT